MPRQLLGTAIAANTITTTQLQTTIVNNITQGGGPRVTSLVYPGNDTAGNTVGGQTVYVNGSGFAANAAVYINGSAVPSLAFISASNLQITTPALSSATYPVYVINPETGATAILIPGLIVSGEPSWVTSAGSLSESQDELTAWSYNLSATGDAPITYALAAGNTLPSGISVASNGSISGTLSSPSGNDTTYTFSVVASDAQNQDSTRQFTVTTSTGEGVLFANNVLLIHADGTNNKNNHTFLDSSNNNFTITRNGNASQGTFSPFSQTGWSAYFDGTGDYLSLSTNANLNFGTGNFTVELWVMFASVSSDMAFLGSSQPGGYDILYRPSTGLNIGRINTAFDNTFAWSPVANRWYHIAYSRSGSSLRVFVDGTQVGSTATNSISYDSSGSVIIGGSTTNDRLMNGYISNMRLVKGTAVYTSNFTPSTTPFTSIANTSLLTCQSNRFIDNSNNAFTITRNGDVSIQAWSPFAPTAAYSTANVGGSGYFDSSGDWLSFGAQSAFNCGTATDFCMEAWVYRIGSNMHIWGAHQAAVADGFYFTTSGFNVYSGGGGGAGVTSLSKAVPAYAWSHVVLTRQNDRLRYFLNGELIGTSTSSVQVNTDGRAVGINGGVNFTGDAGYIAGSRFIKGAVPIAYNTAVTTTNTQIFIPPSAPVTTTSQNANSSQVIALVNYTNAGIFDQTAKNVLETVGDAKVSTAQYKYGTGSMYFDGTGDYLTIPSTPAFNLSTGDWTIESWINLSTLTAEARIWSLGTYGSNPEVALLIGGGGAGGSSNDLQLNYLGNSTLITASSVNSTGVWMHVAVVRSSGTTTLYVNGVSKGTTATNPWTSASTRFWVGGWSQNNNQMTGYIDDLRITKSYARYTSNFTPPTSALKDK